MPKLPKLKLFSQSKQSPGAIAKSCTGAPSAQFFEPYINWFNNNNGREVTKPSQQSVWVGNAMEIRKWVSHIPIIAVKGRNEDKEVVDSPILDLISNPIGKQTWCQFCDQIVDDSDTSGEWFVLKYDKLGRQVEKNPEVLYRIDPANLRLEKLDAFDQPALWKWMRTQNGITTEEFIEDKYLIRFAMFDRFTPHRGIGIVERLLETIDAEHMGRVHNLRMMKHSGRINNLITFDRDMPPHPEEIQAVQEAYTRSMGGYKNAGKDFFVGEKMNIQSLNASSKDLDWLNAQMLNLTEIASAFGIPKVLLGDDTHSTYNNYETARKTLYEDRLLPMLTKHILDPLFNALSHMDSGVRLETDLSAVPAFTEDQKGKAETFEIYVRNGVSRVQANKITGAGIEFDESEADTEYLPNGFVAIETVEESTVGDDGVSIAEATASVDSTLNGAQITSLVNVVQSIATGELPKATGVEIILASFPFDRARAEQIVADVSEGSLSPEEIQATLQAESFAKSIIEETEKAEEPLVVDEETKQSRDWVYKAIANPRDEQERLLKKKFERFANEQRGRVLKAFAELEEELPYLIAKFTGGVQKREPTIEEMDFASRVFNLELENKELLSIMRPVIASTIGIALAQVIKEEGAEEQEFNVDNFVEARLNQEIIMQKVNETSRKRVALAFEKVAEGLAEGLTAEDIAEEIRGDIKNVYKDLAKHRSTTFARTEVGRAFSGTRLQMFKELGTEKIQWLSSRDEVVRDSHDVHTGIDGKVVNLGESFIPGISLTYPQDPSAPPEETINCRCVVISADV